MTDYTKWETNPYFDKSEFTCQCGCGENRMDSDFMERLTILRQLCNFPFIITSGYRCPAHNAAVSSTGETGPHTTGCAADIKCSGQQAHKFLNKALDFGFQGIGVSQRGDHASRFIHVDDLTQTEEPTRPWVWSY